MKTAIGGERASQGWEAVQKEEDKRKSVNLMIKKRKEPVEGRNVVDLMINRRKEITDRPIKATRAIKRR